MKKELNIERGIFEEKVQDMNRIVEQVKGFLYFIFPGEAKGARS